MREGTIIDKILVDKEGYNQFLTLLAELNDESINNASTSSEAYESAIGDGWHDILPMNQCTKNTK